MTPQNGFNNIGGLFCLGWVGTNLVWSGEAPPPVKPAAPAEQVVPVPTGEYRVARKAASEMGRFQ